MFSYGCKIFCVRSLTNAQDWTLFKNHVQAMLSKYVPSKQLSTRHNLPWFDKKAKSLVRLKQKLYNRAKLTGNTNDWQKYRNVKKSTNHHLKRSHRHHVNNKLSDALENNNTKPFWSYIKSLRNDNNGVAPIKAEGKLHSDPTQKANLLNRQFQSVFVKEDHKIPVPKLGDTTAPTIGDLKITTKGVEKQLSTLNINKASGPDQIPNIFLKQTAKESASVLAALFTQSLQTGNLPDDWLSANVSPIFKKGDRGLASNYRPVSLTCVCCKLMEHILVRHMLRHFDDKKIISDKQHGFRKGHSCETQLITTVNDLLASADVGNRMDIAILDFSKAFDMVSHRRLMSKLDHYGIRGNIHKWISSFLNNRNQKVVIDGYSSDTISVDSGVPQGSVLGPILFLVFINDLPDLVKSQCRLFADDCLLYNEIQTFNDSLQLQKDLKLLENWAEEWGMKFNAKKCYIISTEKGGIPFFYTLNDHIFQYVGTNPYLGVTLSEDLTFDAHVGNITKKGSRMLGFIQRNLKGSPSRLKELAYLTLVRSGLEYASVVWDPFLQREIDRLEKIQRRAARFVTNNYRRECGLTSTQLIDSLGWDSLQERRKTARLCMLYKAINGEVALSIDMLCRPDNRTRGSTQNFRTIQTKKKTVCKFLLH